MEVSILTNFDQYYLNKAFANNTYSMRISPTFVLDNSIHSAKCQGSNYLILMNDTAVMKTMETLDNFPYVKGMTNADFSLTPAKINEEQYITPFKYTRQLQNNTITSNTNLLIIKLHNDVQTVPFTQQEVNNIKWLLARGITIQGSMYVSVNSKDQAKFSQYKGGIIDGACNSTTIDHAIQFIGYGKYKGKEVFVVRNSWGRDFGVDGTFYTEIGKNSYCIENEANSNVPQGFTAEEFGNTQPLDFTNINQFVYKKQYKIQEGQNGLDKENGQYNAQLLSDNIIFLTLFFIILIVSIIIQLIQYCINRKQKEQEDDYEQQLTNSSQ